MPDKGDVLDNTQEALEYVSDDIGNALNELLDTVKPIPGHLNDLISRVAALELVNAAKVVPETISDESKHLGKSVTAVGDTGADAVGTIPAASRDVLEDIGDVADTTTRSARTGKVLFKRRKS